MRILSKTKKKITELKLPEEKLKLEEEEKQEQETNVEEAKGPWSEAPFLPVLPSLVEQAE